MPHVSLISADLKIPSVTQWLVGTAFEAAAKGENISERMSTCTCKVYGYMHARRELISLKTALRFG